jgi:hypothetical protein
VVWGDAAGAVRRTTKDGSSTELLFETGCSLVDIAVDVTYAYVGYNCPKLTDQTATARVARVDLLTKATYSLVELSGSIGHLQIVADTLYVSWSAGSTLITTVNRESSEAIAASTHISGVTPGGFVGSEAFAISGTSIYFVSQGKELAQGDLASHDSTVVTSLAATVLDIQPVGNGVAWLEFDTSSLPGTYRIRAKTAGDEVTSITRDVPFMAAFAGDTRGYYGIGQTQSGGQLELYDWALSAQEPDVLATGFRGTSRVAVDDQSIWVTEYWSDGKSNVARLMRIQK